MHVTATRSSGFIWGRLRLGTRLDIEKGEGAFYKYGSLLARIHDHNYATIDTQPSEVFYLDEPEKFHGTEIILRDADSATVDDPEQTTYPAGTDHWFLAEIFPYTSDMAGDFAAIHDGDLRGLSFREGPVTWHVVHNLGDANAEWSAGVPDGATCVLYRGGSGPIERPDEGRALQVRGDRITVDIESLQHVVVKVVTE